jgi:hypothetical protein
MWPATSLGPIASAASGGAPSRRSACAARRVSAGGIEIRKTSFAASNVTSKPRPRSAASVIRGPRSPYFSPTRADSRTRASSAAASTAVEAIGSAPGASSTMIVPRLTPSIDSSSGARLARGACANTRAYSAGSPGSAAAREAADPTVSAMARA